MELISRTPLVVLILMFSAWCAGNWFALRLLFRKPADQHERSILSQGRFFGVVMTVSSGLFLPQVLPFEETPDWLEGVCWSILGFPVWVLLGNAWAIGCYGVIKK
jgi:hypothetical protein